MGSSRPTDMDGNANPYYDDLEGNGTPDGLIAIREGYIRSAYHEADAKLARTRSLMGEDETSSPAPTTGSRRSGTRSTPARCSPTPVCSRPSSRATAAPRRRRRTWRRPAGQGVARADLRQPRRPRSGRQSTCPAPDYEAGRATQIINAFQNLTDPANPGKQVVLKVMKKEELRNVDGTDSLHPSRSGDVVVVLRPPYQFDAATPGQRDRVLAVLRPARLPARPGRPPAQREHARHVRGGRPGIPHKTPRSRRACDRPRADPVFLLGIPGPQNARGKILYELTKTPGQYKEVTILDISDYHGQLVPLAEAADNVSGGGSSNPTFTIGGSAFLKPWFDSTAPRRRTARSRWPRATPVGATPPISAFFGDTPTIELMNMMGIQLDGLGNHNFDKGSGVPPQHADPAGELPVHLLERGRRARQDAGAVEAVGHRSRSTAVKVGFVGFTNEDAPTLVSPTAFDPFHVADVSRGCRQRSAACAMQGVKTIIVIGHDGATAGTLTTPTGPSWTSPTS